MSAFLAKWSNSGLEQNSAVQTYSFAASPEAEGRAQKPDAPESLEYEQGVPWAEWKAAALNRLFQDQGVTGLPGRITAATVLHGQHR